MDAHLPDPSGLRAAAKQLWAEQSARRWAEILSVRIRRTEQTLPASAPGAAVAGLKKWAKHCAGPAFDTVRALCGGWVTDARYGRAVRACPWCGKARGHRLSDLLGCGSLDRGLERAGLRWMRQPGSRARRLRMLWAHEGRGTPAASLLVATDAACFALHGGRTHPLEALLNARVRALLLRHPRLAVEVLAPSRPDLRGRKRR